MLYQNLKEKEDLSNVESISKVTKKTKASA